MSKFEKLEQDNKTIKFEIDKKCDKTKEYNDSIVSFDNNKIFLEFFSKNESSKDSERPSNYFSKAMLLCLKEDYQEALQVMNNAIKQDPSFSDYLLFEERFISIWEKKRLFQIILKKSI